MSRLKECAAVLLILLGAILIFSFLPLGTALEFVGDERYELIKGFLCSKGFVLYKQIWNDQPPVLTMLLSGAFQVWGPAVLTARLVAAGFGLLLLTVFYGLVRQRSSLWRSLLAAFFLLASPGVLLLSASVMLEVPAIGTALVSAWLVQEWRQRRQWGWLAASGAVMGLALQIKFTAAVVGPAIAAEIMLEQKPAQRREWLRAKFVQLACWATGTAAVLTLIGFTWGRGSFGISFHSHFIEHAVSGLGKPSDYRFQPELLLKHLDGVLAAAAGLGILLARRRWDEVRFPGIMLATVTIIHAIHRPWWNYYYLHFAVPLAWLAGWGVVEVLARASELMSAARLRLCSPGVLKGLVLCSAAALVVARAESRLEVSIRDIRQSPRTSASAVLAKMRQYAPRTHWVYAEPVIYPFHARLLVPPQLAVVMAKRAWSGQISTAEMVAVCQRCRPEQILLPNGIVLGEWEDFLKTNYLVAFADEKSVLYVAKGLER